MVQKFEEVLIGGVALMNEMECPYLLAMHRFEVVPSDNILGSISILHECSSSCKMFPTRTAVIERETVTVSAAEHLEHDTTNDMYFINTYSINYHHVTH